MKVIDWLFARKPLAWLTVTERKIESDLDEANELRKDLDRRVENVTKATLNGEEEWFLRLVKKDPECALDIITSCADDKLTKNEG